MCSTPAAPSGCDQHQTAGGKREQAGKKWQKILKMFFYLIHKFTFIDSNQGKKGVLLAIVFHLRGERVIIILMLVCKAYKLHKTAWNNKKCTLQH